MTRYGGFFIAHTLTHSLSGSRYETAAIHRFTADIASDAEVFTFSGAA